MKKLREINEVSFLKNGVSCNFELILKRACYIERSVPSAEGNSNYIGCEKGGEPNKPKLHGFCRSFALSMLRSGVDIFVLQRLMGHADLQVLRRYLAQNDEDNQLPHLRGCPVDNNLT